MKVILQQDVKGLGRKGEVVNASDGHARNFLFPKKMAIPADKQNLNELSAKKSSEAHKKELERQEAIKIREKLEKVTLHIKTKAGENGKKEYKENIDKKKILLKDQIKTLGEHTVDLKLFEGVVAKLKLIIEEEN